MQAVTSTMHTARCTLCIVFDSRVLRLFKGREHNAGSCLWLSCMQSLMPANLHHQDLVSRSAAPCVAHCQRHCNFSQWKPSQPHHQRRALRRQCCAEQQSNTCFASHKPGCCWFHQVHISLVVALCHSHTGFTVCTFKITPAHNARKAHLTNMHAQLLYHTCSPL